MKQDKGTETRALETMSTEPPHPSTSPLRPPNSLPPSLLERYFARHEFSTPFLACCSDVEPLTVPELLEIAEGEGPGCGERGAAILGGLSLGYVDPRGSTRLREAVAREHGGGGEGGDGDAITADDVLVAAPQELAYLLQRSLLQGKGEEESERGGAKVATGQRAREGGHNVATGQRRKQRKKTHPPPPPLPLSLNKMPFLSSSSLPRGRHHRRAVAGIPWTHRRRRGRRGHRRPLAAPLGGGGGGGALPLLLLLLLPPLLPLRPRRLPRCCRPSPFPFPSSSSSSSSSSSGAAPALRRRGGPLRRAREGRVASPDEPSRGGR